MSIKEVQPYYSEVDILSTHGRIGRKSYFVFSIILPFICFWVLASLAGVIFKYGASLGVISTTVSYILLALGVLSLIVITVRLTILRCHDFNANGWMAIFAVIPLANIVFSLIPGNNGLNSYGDAPEPPPSTVKVGTIILIILMAVTALYVAYQLINHYIPFSFI